MGFVELWKAINSKKATTRISNNGSFLHNLRRFIFHLVCTITCLGVTTL